MFTAGGKKGYVAEKAETEKGWLFPVGDEVVELGYTDMLTDMFNAFENKTEPKETFYDGYIVNEIMDACYRSAKSKRWEPVRLKIWRGREKTERISAIRDFDKDHLLVKEETMPDGTIKLILKNKQTGIISQKTRK
ncbi:MAG: hypothetical protein A2Y81_12400 [Nitrospirae bacterium RBG_13_43_8]|nr:MAG: hypothetical protein A2Y81_12400 [Nitrospirae bacterium RBG_13_43_8]